MSAAIVAELGLASCACCEQPTELIENIGGAQLCPACAPLLRRAIAEDGSILRWRCSPMLVGAPPVCGRVHRVAFQPNRCGPIVADTSSICSTCRPAQRAYVESRVGAISWEDTVNA
jgi:hypothetical protein